MCSLEPRTSNLEPRLRLFVAVLLPEGWREYLGALAGSLEASSPGYARWVARDSLHLTLVFLGSQPAERREAIVTACRFAAGGVRPFELGLGQPGYFGQGQLPRVIWVDVADRAGGLPALHRRLSRAFERASVGFDRRPLVPHITLGRAQRDASGDQGRLMAAGLRSLGEPLPTPPAGFTLQAISLMRSELSSRGARYTELERIGLGVTEAG